VKCISNTFSIVQQSNNNPIQIKRKQVIQTSVTMSSTTTVSTSQRVKRIKGQGTRHVHLKNTNGNYGCDYCDFETKKQSTLSEHIARKHAEEAGRQVKAFACSHCDATFQASTQLQHHVTNHHKEASIVCPIDGCGKMTKSLQTMLSHYTNKHMDKTLCIVIEPNDVVQCKECKKRMKMSNVPYHLAKCNLASPFSTGAVMCDGGDDHIVFKARRV